MTTPSILPAGRCSREENRARRAWASAHSRHAPVALQLLGNLLPVLDSPHPLYSHIARRALASGDLKKMLTASTVCPEIYYCLCQN